MVRKAVHNAFLNTLTIETSFPRVPRTRLKFDERAFSVALPPQSMEPAANRTQADAFHASFQALLENVLVFFQTAYCIYSSGIALLNWTV